MLILAYLPFAFGAGFALASMAHDLPCAFRTACALSAQLGA